MTFKLMISVLIIVLSMFAGRLKCKPFENRVEHLESLSLAFGILEAEMRYRMDPLEESFQQISKLSEGYTKSLFLSASLMLKNCRFDTFETKWKEAVTLTYNNSSLTPKDLQIICDVGLDLGKTDIAGQNNLFSRISLQLADQLKEAVEVKESKGKMYKSLGTDMLPL